MRAPWNTCVGFREHVYFLVYVFRVCSPNPFSFACQPRRVQSLRTDFANRNTISPLLSHLTLFKKHLSIQSRLGKKRPRKTFNCTQLPTVGIKTQRDADFFIFSNPTTFKVHLFGSSKLHFSPDLCGAALTSTALFYCLLEEAVRFFGGRHLNS